MYHLQHIHGHGISFSFTIDDLNCSISPLPNSKFPDFLQFSCNRETPRLFAKFSDFPWFWKKNPLPDFSLNRMNPVYFLIGFQVLVSYSLLWCGKLYLVGRFWRPFSKGLIWFVVVSLCRNMQIYCQWHHKRMYVHTYTHVLHTHTLHIHWTLALHTHAAHPRCAHIHTRTRAHTHARTHIAIGHSCHLAKVYMANIEASSRYFNHHTKFLFIDSQRLLRSTIKQITCIFYHLYMYKTYRIATFVESINIVHP